MAYSSERSQDARRGFLDPRTKLALVLVLAVFVMGGLGGEALRPVELSYREKHSPGDPGHSSFRTHGVLRALPGAVFRQLSEAKSATAWTMILQRNGRKWNLSQGFSVHSRWHSANLICAVKSRRI